MIPTFDQETLDLDLTSQVTCLTNTPDASNNVLAQAVIALGTGAKPLDGTGGNFEVTITIGGVTVEPDPQIIVVSSGQTTCYFVSAPFIVPANQEVILKLKSPNAGDTDVQVISTLANVFPFDFTGTDVHATLDGEEVTTDAASRTASQADVSALATQASLNLQSLVVNEIDANVEALQKIAEADLFIDTTTDPWELQWREKGTATVIHKKALYEADGTAITAVTQLIARQTDSP